MDPKDQWSLFGEMIFTVSLTAAAIAFIINNDIYAAQQFFRQMMPFLVVFAVYLLKNNLDKYNLKYHRRTARSVSVSYDYRNIFITNLVLFGAPCAVLLAAIFFKGAAMTEDIVQASLVFIIFYYWQRSIYGGSSSDY